MAAPTLEPGVIEQGLYTWSSRNLVRGKGEGFGKVSPGLAHNVPWLEKIVKDRFHLNERLAGGEVKPYQGWRAFIGIGTFRAGGLSIVYRKTADAGCDTLKRERFLVQALVGRAEDLDLAAVGDDGAPWLHPDDCPLDALPPLASLTSEELPLRSPTVAGAPLDERARALLDRLLASPSELRVAIDPAAAPADLATELLAALPTALWPCAELDWFLGAEGPVGRVRVRRDASPHEPAPERAAPVACDLHRIVEAVWAELPRNQRTWTGFASGFARIEQQLTLRERAAREQAVRAEALREQAAEERAAREQAARRKAAHQPAPDAPPRATPEQTADATDAGLSLHDRAAAAIAATMRDATWPPAHAFEDGETRRALRALEQLDGSRDAWVALLEKDRLRGLLKNVETPTTFLAAVSFFDAIELPTTDLAALWQETSLAAVGFALFRRDVRPLTESRWAVPKTIDRRQLRMLVEQLLKTERGQDELGALWRNGFAGAAGPRQQLLRVFTEIGTSPRQLYEHIVPRAALTPDDVLEIWREDVDRVVRWLGLTDANADAFRLSLRRGLLRTLFG